MSIEERMLLFYLILVENESFRVYILSRTDPETLVRMILVVHKGHCANLILFVT